MFSLISEFPQFTTCPPQDIHAGRGVNEQNTVQEHSPLNMYKKSRLLLQKAAFREPEVFPES